MKKRFLPWLGACLAVLCAESAHAHPYASGVTNESNTISWVLNEAATDVKVLFDKGSVTNDLGSAPVVGTNTFSLGAHTNFQIVVFKVGSNTLNQISTDNNINNNIYGPRGVAVNQSARDWNFGRVYVANANPGTATDGRVTTKGIYVMDAASEDFLGLGNTAATAGITFGSSTTYSPYKLFVGPDDKLYVGDAATGTIGGIWMTDPSCATSTDVFTAASVGGIFPPPANYGRIIGTPNVTGSLSTTNLVLIVTEWDYTNNQSTAFQTIWKYGIHAGPLPWSIIPTAILNPISTTANGTQMDAQVAPDGKYFITALHSSASDGGTNVCVLSSTGTLLWDSKTQSKNYFSDLSNDHLCIQNYSIAVSPDDSYVAIQGAVNNNFLLMSLTNGVPDVSTLTTNTTVGANGGSTCRAASWDAADNIYVISGGSDTLRIFSLGLTSTCTTSNDFTCTNGSFQISLASAAIPSFQIQPTNQTAQCSSNVVFVAVAGGAAPSYQWYVNNSAMSSSTNTSVTNATLTLTNVTVAQSGNSYTVVANNLSGSATSQVAVLTVVDTIPPVLTLNGPSATNILQGAPFNDPGASASDACAGSLTVTSSGSVNTNLGGTYVISYFAADPSHNTGSVTRTVGVIATNGPPVFLQEPSGQTAECSSTVNLSVAMSGAMPFTYQWFVGGSPLSNGATTSGATSASLTLSSVAISQSGSYTVVVTNSVNSATSQVAVLVVHDTTPPVITVNGSTAITTSQGATFTDPGATAYDACAGSLAVTTTGSVNVSTTGIYTLSYSATDPSVNSSTATRTVTVIPVIAPVTAITPAIIPMPSNMVVHAGTYTLCPSQSVPPIPAHATTRILVDSSSQATGQYLATMLGRSTGFQFQIATNAATNAVKGAILITTSNAVASLGAEGYELTVAPDSVVIRAPAQGGTFYGVQSLLQLLPPQILSLHTVSSVPWVAPCVYIEDQPLYSWRGLMLDVARHFCNKQEVKQVIDAMALHKLNTFHWHLVDDQGWRLQITNWPALTTNSAWRAAMDYGLNPRSNSATNAAGQYGGFYTQADAREIVAYAAERHITVVPEIEMPCHSTAGLAAYPQFGCGNPQGDYDMDYPSIDYGVDLYSLGTPGTIPFLEEILTEVMQIFPSKYIHCGGDEVSESQDVQWEQYNADVTNMTALGISTIVGYQHWLSTNLSAFVQSKGRVMMGWTEYENGGVIPNAALMDWQTGTSSQATNVATAGLPVVMAPDNECYLNYVETTTNGSEPYFIVGNSPSFLSVKTVYNYNPMPSGLAAPYTTNILGAQCSCWAEYIPSFENFMFKIFPRECAMAEITWTPRASQNYSSFTNRLATHKQRLAAAGINYNHEGATQIGTWGPTVSTTYSTVSYTITPYVTAAGEIDVNFFYTTGSDGLSITSAALLQNGVQIDIDNFTGFAGDAYGALPYYVLHLASYKPGATYTIQATIAGSGGTSSSGSVYLVNFN